MHIEKGHITFTQLRTGQNWGQSFSFYKGVVHYQFAPSLSLMLTLTLTLSCLWGHFLTGEPWSLIFVPPELCACWKFCLASQSLQSSQLLSLPPCSADEPAIIALREKIAHGAALTPLHFPSLQDLESSSHSFPFNPELDFLFPQSLETVKSFTQQLFSAQLSVQLLSLLLCTGYK